MVVYEEITPHDMVHFVCANIAIIEFQILESWSFWQKSRFCHALA